MMRLTRAFVIVCVALGMAGLRAMPAHAQTTFTVTNCSNDTQLRADVTTANTNNDGDTIDITCTQPIPLTALLTITGTMTIEGSPATATINGQNATQIFFVGNTLSSPTLTLRNLTLENGKASLGGAMEVYAGEVDIYDSTLELNESGSGGGGAIYNVYGTVNIYDSLFEDNVATAGGGGAAIENDATLNIYTSTFYGNYTTAAGGTIGAGNGGAIYNIAALQAATTTATNSTFTENTAESGAAVYAFGETYNSQVSFGADIIANNKTGGNCSKSGTGSSFSDLGYNVTDDNGTDCGLTDPTDQTNTDPDLAIIADNGGPTFTVALQPGSSAIDYIPVGVANNLCPATGGTDQRGYPRPDANEAYCDVGAYEYQDTEFPTGNGQNAYDIESSNFYCTGGGTVCVPTGTVASECFTLAPCSGVTYGDAEAFGTPNGASYGVPDELVLACVHGTSTGYDIGYLDVVSSQGKTDYPVGTRYDPGVYGNASTGVIGGKGTLIGGDGSEDNLTQTSSISASAYDMGRGVRGSVTGIQNTDNNANRLNNGTFRVTLTGTLWHVDITGTYALADPYPGTISCTVGGAHAYDLLTAGMDTSALAEGELENTLGDNLFAQSLATPPYRF